MAYELPEVLIHKRTDIYSSILMHNNSPWRGMVIPLGPLTRAQILPPKDPTLNTIPLGVRFQTGMWQKWQTLGQNNGIQVAWRFFTAHITPKEFQPLFLVNQLKYLHMQLGFFVNIPHPPPKRHQILAT